MQISPGYLNSEMNKPQMIQLRVSEKIGNVSALLVEPAPCMAVLVLAHGAGAGMTHPFMESMAHSLADSAIGSLRFNFPYMENRKKRPDPPAIAHLTVEAALHSAHERFPKVPIFAGGKSFGGRMTSQFISKTPVEFVSGLVFLGFPLHAAGKPSVERADHLAQVTTPMLFLQGTKDTLAEIGLITKVCNTLPHSTLVTFEGADHSFKAGKRNLIPELSQSIHDWMSGIIA